MAAAVCAAAGTEGAQDGRGVDGGGRGGAGLLREVGGERGVGGRGGAPTPSATWSAGQGGPGKGA